jgi:pimeloyl-ACP methyl ester carboxylesterase
MARLQAGGVQLGWREWGGGDVTVVFIHGNLASKDWIELAAPLFPSGLRVIGLDWRGCGESDRPKATTDYSNYSMQQHAEDMLAALDSLDVRFCHLATHSTAGMQPQRFGRVLALDPVTPLGMLFNADQISLFRSMMASRELTRAVMATAASSLFVPESLAPNAIPRFREGVGEIAALFERILEQTFGVPRASGSVRRSISPASGRVANWSAAWRRSIIRIWCCGASATAGFRPPILRTMAAAMPDCRLVVMPGIGHSMNLELPALYAGYFGAWFGGLSR